MAQKKYYSNKFKFGKGESTISQRNKGTVSFWAIIPITGLLDNPPSLKLSAYREQKALALSLPTYNKKNAEKLYEVSNKILSELK